MKKLFILSTAFGDYVFVVLVIQYSKSKQSFKIVNLSWQMVFNQNQKSKIFFTLKRSQQFWKLPISGENQNFYFGGNLIIIILWSLEFEMNCLKLGHFNLQDTCSTKK